MLTEDGPRHEADVLDGLAVEEGQRAEQPEVDADEGATDGEGHGGLDLHEGGEVAGDHHQEKELVAWGQRAAAAAAARSASALRGLAAAAPWAKRAYRGLASGRQARNKGMQWAGTVGELTSPTAAAPADRHAAHTAYCVLWPGCFRERPASINAARGLHVVNVVFFRLVCDYRK